MSRSTNHVLIVCQHFWPESFRVNDIADYLVENNHQVDVLCGLPNYPSGKFPQGYGYFKKRNQTHNGVRIYRAFEIPRGSNSNLRIFLNYVSFPVTSLFHIPRLLTKHYDKILIYQLSPVMMSIAGILIGKIKKTETTMYVLDLWPENLYSVLDIKNPILRRIASYISHWHYRHVDKLIALSESMRLKLIEVTGVSADKIIVLPQAPEKIYEKTLHDKVLSKKYEKSFNIVFTGNISPAQSFETILDAAQILSSSGITDVRWIIVGDGMARKWLEDEVRKRNLIEAFSFEGQHPVEDIPKYTDLADILVGCLVKSELLEATIPAKVMSYIASGKPVVLAMDGEVQDLINNKIGCGFAGPTEDAVALADNIKKIYSLPESKRITLGKKAQDYHFEHFERNLILSKMRGFLYR